MASVARSVVLPTRHLADLITGTTRNTPVLAAKVQSIQDSLASLEQLPGRYFNKVSANADQLNRQLSKHSAKALRRCRNEEEKINHKLSRIDSLR